MPKVASLNSKHGKSGCAVSPEKYDKFTECSIACEKKCLGMMVCSHCGHASKPVMPKGPGKKLGGKAPVKKLSPQDRARSATLCKSGPLMSREKKVLLEIARKLDIKGVSMRTTKDVLCSKIRAATK